MRYKKHMLLLALAIFLLGIAGAWASDTNDTMIGNTDDSAVELSDDDIIVNYENEDVLNANEKTFGDLNTTINGNGDHDIYLDSDYKYSDDDSAFKEGIIIDRDLNVYGNGHTINGSDQARIFKINSGTVVFHNIIFTKGNAGGYDVGGAIYGECTAVDCTFTNNQAGYGGAMWLGSAVNCTFTDNRGIFDGGAMELGLAINCTFIGNRAGYGGAMLGGSAVNCTFIGNQVDYYGGAMQSGSAVNCTFTDNRAIFDGGAMEESLAINCTFSGNRAMSGGAMNGCYYSACIGQEGDYYDCHPLDLYFDVSDFTSTYKSNKGFYIILNGQNARINFINVDVVIYKEGVGEVMRYSCLSGDSLIFDLAAGTYTAKLITTYPNLDQISKNITLTINKATPKIEVTVNESTYPDDVIVNVKSDLKGTYVVKVGDKTQIMTLEANVAQNIIFTGIAAREEGYIVNVTHDSENYTGFNDTAKAILHKATPKIEVTAYESTYPNLIVNVKTDVSGEYVVKVGDKTQIVTLEANVAQDITFTGLAASEEGYIVNVTHDSENYTGFNDTAKAILHKATPKLTAKAKTFKSSVKTKKYTIVLKDNTGKAIKNAKVTLKVKGKTYKATTNSKGKATFKITKLTKKGTYKATITFKGDKNYKKVTKKAKIKVIITFKTVSKGSKDKATVKEIQQALKDNGYYLTYKGHYLKIDGIYKGCTERSVKQFQKAKHLKVTGKVDEKTAKKLGLI